MRSVSGPPVITPTLATKFAPTTAPIKTGAIGCANQRNRAGVHAGLVKGHVA